MALPPLQDLLNLLQDNVAGDISAADMQTITTALYNGISDAGGGGGGGSIPVAGLLPWPDSSLPTGFLDCNGQAVSRTTYAALFAIIGIKYGAGDNVNTFNLPDYRGYFLRTMDAGAGVDPDAATRTNRGDGTIGDSVGTKQTDAFKSHFHSSASYTLNGGNQNRFTASGQTNGADVDTKNTGGAETRGKNIYVRVLIRWQSTVTEFVSAPIALTTGTHVITATAHGFGVVPARLEAWLQCNTADLGYSASNRVKLVGLRWDGAANNGIELSADSTNITPCQLTGVKILHKTTSVLTAITYANWSLILKAGI